MLSLVSTWMGDRLGTLGAVGFNPFAFASFSSAFFCTKIHHMPNPSAVKIFFMEFAASNLFENDFDDSPTDRFEISKKE